jgi:hypothetical protein
MRTPRAPLLWQKLVVTPKPTRNATSDPTGERAILMSKTFTPPRGEKFDVEGNIFNGKYFLKFGWA